MSEKVWLITGTGRDDESDAAGFQILLVAEANQRRMVHCSDAMTEAQRNV